MPRSSAEQAKTITIQLQWVLTLDALPAWVKPGTVVAFKGRLTADGVGQDGQTVLIWWGKPGYKFLSPNLTTSGGGYFSWNWTVPYTEPDYAGAPVTMPCQSHIVYAYNVTAGDSNTYILKIAYNMQIFKDRVGGTPGIQTPDSAFKGVAFGIQGYLGQEAPAGTWSPVSGKTITLVYNGNSIGMATTEVDGRFSKVTSIGTVGTYTLKATFGAEGLSAVAMRVTTIVGPRTFVVLGLFAAIGIAASLVGSRRM